MRVLTASTARDAAQCTEIVNRVMRAAAGGARAVITDAADARLAQLEQTNDELGKLLSQALDALERERVASALELLRERGVSADLLERNAVLHDGAIGQKNEIIRLRAQLAEYGDRLGDYAGEVWARCPNCTGEMAVTDGEMLERVS